MARRSLMRAVLGHVLGTDDGALVISRRCPTCGSADHGRPFVADVPISYSVSSNGGVAAMATSVLSQSVGSGSGTDQAIGVDIEVGRVDGAIPLTALTEHERRAIEVLPSDQQDTVAVARSPDHSHRVLHR